MECGGIAALCEVRWVDWGLPELLYGETGHFSPPAASWRLPPHQVA
jgi:hypothetical protein